MKNFDIAVDRDSFAKWTEGYLLWRHGNKLIIGDTLANRKAEKILKKGGTVLLTVDSEPVSTVYFDKKKNSYVETPLKPKKEKPHGRSRKSTSR
jgi:hypothetical protein